MDIPDIETKMRSELPAAVDSKIVPLSNGGYLMLIKVKIGDEYSWWMYNLYDLANHSAERTQCYHVRHDPATDFLSLHW